ncbi:hypothetical protein [Paenibacillus sp. IHBB 10380]|uniref:hypothetical protein n=1 Tax=Paenibacillus sp. IHBB 10380 TaxID=1566358 RepID=UPI0005CFB3A3|nr:hypothetical protein [Paenibacillus sp. IHBB 10380]AJS57888.1 hypothetical protein UB51_04600 [Paenibacillus sp. IHBB 10380]
MSKKLEKNGLWESSRMMLPQHKEAFQNRLSDKAVHPSCPTTEEINMMKDFVLLPIMHSIIMRKAREIERSSEMLRVLYTKVAQLLAKNMYTDLSKVKRSLLEKNIRVFEEEKDDQMVRYRYIYRNYEDSFVITRSYMRAEVSMRIGRYADVLITNICNKKKPDN